MLCIYHEKLDRLNFHGLSAARVVVGSENALLATFLAEMFTRPCRKHARRRPELISMYIMISSSFNDIVFLFHRHRIYIYLFISRYSDSTVILPPPPPVILRNINNNISIT